MERKFFQAPVLLKSGAQGSFRARIAQLNTVDHEGDVTLPGAFPVGKSVVISAYQHASWNSALPVGKGIIGANQTAAWVDGEFFTDTTSGRDHYLTVKELASAGLGDWSYGYQAVGDTSATKADRERWPGVKRILRKLEVYEASPVLVGAGIGTATESIKSGWHGSDDELRRAKEQLARADLINAKAGLAILKDKGNVDFGEVDEAYIRKEDVDLAWGILEQCCAYLGAETPEIRWYSKESADEQAYRKEYGYADWPSFRGQPGLMGRTPIGEKFIWILADLEGSELVETVAHEAKHLASADSGTDEGEAEADAFGKWVRENYESD